MKEKMFAKISLYWWLICLFTVFIFVKKIKNQKIFKKLQWKFFYKFYSTFNSIKRAHYKRYKGEILHNLKWETNWAHSFEIHLIHLDQHLGFRPLIDDDGGEDFVVVERQCPLSERDGEELLRCVHRLVGEADEDVGDHFVESRARGGEELKFDFLLKIFLNLKFLTSNNWPTSPKQRSTLSLGAHRRPVSTKPMCEIAEGW